MMGPKDDNDKKALSKIEEAKRLIERCAVESDELTGILRASSSYYDELSRRVELAEANIKTLESRYILLDNFAANVEKIIETTVKEALTEVRDDIKILRREQSSLIRIREKLTNAVYVLAGIGAISLIFAIANMSIQTFTKLTLSAGKTLGGP